MKISPNEAKKLDSDAVRLEKAVHILAEIEELAQHIEDPGVMRRWVLKLAKSRHEGVYNVRFASVVGSPVAAGSEDIERHKKALNAWFKSLSEFVGSMMTAKRGMNDEQVQAAFAKWETENKRPEIK